MFCKKCGTEIRPRAKFCAKCGTPVPAEAAGPSVIHSDPPVKHPEPVKPGEAAEEVKTLLTRDEATTGIRSGGPAEYADTPKRETPKGEMPKDEPAEEGKLIMTMTGKSESSSNGQFNDWFSDPGDL